MLSILEQGVAGWLATPGWELLAAGLALVYLVLAMRQNPWCWPAAFVSTLIYTLLFWDLSLLMESLLNGYYLVMAVYGWYAWTRGAKDPAKHSTTTLGITRWPLGRHLTIIGLLTLVSLSLGYLMATYTHADFAYLDTFTTVFSVFTTWLVAKKVLENWLYWLVIDAASIYLYLQKGLFPTVILFTIYCFLAVLGYLQWRRQVDSPPLATAQ